MNARALARGRERELTEVPWLKAIGDVVSTVATPSNHVFYRNQDATIRARSTARSATEAIEIFVGDEHADE
jgi:hypothetical protein